MEIAVRIVLMPLLLAQAAHLRMRTVQLPEPRGTRTGRVGQGPLLRILVLGDSSAAGVGVGRQEQALLGQIIADLAHVATVDYALMARSGARTQHALNWLSHAPADRFDVVITALGVNDVTKAVSLRRFMRLQGALLDGLVSRFGARRIIVSGLPPMDQFPLLPQPMRWVLGRQAARFDRALQSIVEDRPYAQVITVDMGLDHSNMAVDGFHPGPQVYAAWARHVVAAIKADPALLDAGRTSA
jgi:lysophospholipase L1-like esterase